MHCWDGWDIPAGTSPPAQALGELPRGSPLGPARRERLPREAGRGKTSPRHFPLGRFRTKISNFHTRCPRQLWCVSQKLHQCTQSPSLLSCRSRGIIRAILWATLPAEGVSRRFPFLNRSSLPLWRHWKKMSLFKPLFLHSFQSQGTFARPGEKTAVRVKVRLRINAAAKPKCFCGANCRAESSTLRCPRSPHFCAKSTTRRPPWPQLSLPQKP